MSFEVTLALERREAGMLERLQAVPRIERLQVQRTSGPIVQAQVVACLISSIR
jgi:hypothetical protein